MRIQCEAKTMPVERLHPSIARIAKKSEELIANQSNLLQKIQKYKSQHKANLNLEEYISDKLWYRDSRISEYKINPQLSKLREFSKQELLTLKETYSKTYKKDFNITEIESFSKIINQSMNNYLPSIQILAKMGSARVAKFQLKNIESSSSTKESSRTFSGKLSVNSYAKTIVAKMETQRYSQKKMVRSNTIKPKKMKKEKKEVELQFKDLIVLEIFNTSSLSQSLAKDPEIMKIKAKSVTILCENSYLLNTNHNVQRQIASLTKIMTCYVSLLLMRIHHINGRMAVKVSRTASELGGTTAELRPGDLVSYQDLLYGVMLPSGNDAAFTLAEHIGKIIYMKSSEYYKIKEQAKQKLKAKIILTEQDCEKRFSPSTHKSIDCFMNKMNQLANHLHLSNTSFSNTHGLSDINNKSTSRDISVLCHYAIKDPLFRKIVRTKEYTCSVVNQYTKSGRQIVWENTNRLLESSECTGIKTGVTGTAGPCMAASFMRNGKEFIVVILKTTCVNSRFSEVKMLFEKGYKYERKRELMELQEMKLKKSNEQKGKEDIKEQMQ